MIILTSLGSNAACFKDSDNWTRASTPPGGSARNRPNVIVISNDNNDYNRFEMIYRDTFYNNTSL